VLLVLVFVLSVYSYGVLIVFSFLWCFDVVTLCPKKASPTFSTVT